MAISAMSHMLKITKTQLLELRDLCIAKHEDDVSTLSGYRLSRENFVAVMKDANIAEEPDQDVFEQLFIMFDKKGEDYVDPVLFFAGLSPLASVLDVSTKLRFALHVFDYKKTGRISRERLEAVLGAINSTASFFGDAVLLESQIGLIVNDIFEGEELDDETIAYSDKIYKISIHPLVVEFASGAGMARHGI